MTTLKDLLPRCGRRERLWRIWSRDHGAWWCPGGFTKIEANAGQYSMKMTRLMTAHDADVVAIAAGPIPIWDKLMQRWSTKPAKNRANCRRTKRHILERACNGYPVEKYNRK